MRRVQLDLSEPHRVWVWALVGLLAAGVFIWAVIGHTTGEERMNFYDSLGQSTHIRWR